jgi:Flp pilus assembly pilin Flp
VHPKTVLLRAQPLRWRCSRGDAAVEYVVLLGTMAIPLLPVLVALGAWLVGVFENMRNLAVLPFP